MNRWMIAAGTAIAATAALAANAAAETPAPSASGEPAEPVKNCTRYNGHFGFYGNPWCTPEEQESWDKWEAERLRREAASLTRP